ncbi:MAG: hypothetical protein ACPGGK_13460 [Pikeienuella sp.]
MALQETAFIDTYTYAAQGIHKTALVMFDGQVAIPKIVPAF